jgi:cytoskeleton protein RodZ
MATVGEQLRRAREARDLSVEQVAEITKIRTDHVKALEEGNYDVFSAPVYIKGFVRTYSTLLKQDVPATMAALEAELGQTNRFAEAPALTGEPKGIVDFAMLQLSKLDLRKGVWLVGGLGVLVIGVVCFLTWKHYRTRDPLQDVKPGIYQPVQTNRGPTLPLPTNAPRR